MESIYFLCAADGCITSCSKYYKVYVPSSRQGQRDAAFLEKYATNCNYYWHKWDNEVACFFEKIAISLNLRVYQMPLKKIKARCLVAFIKETNSLPKTSEVGREASHLRKLIEPKYHFLRQIKVIQKAEAEKRKKPKLIA